MLGYQGSIDTPTGKGWTSKGYAVYLYTNGQAILMKNGNKLMEGWGVTKNTLAVGNDYEIQIDSYMIGENARRIQAKINGNIAINYVDYNSPINQIGYFACNNSGCAGSITQIGYEFPVITSSTNKALVNQVVTLNCETLEETSEVTYYIDEENSTATGIVTGNTIQATSAGELYVYASVDGLYSENICITVTELKDLVEKYYNQGVYTKKTNIYLNNISKEELSQYFHGAVELDRTTYYNANALLMGDFDGGFDTINSGYGTDENGNMTHFKYDLETQTTKIDYTVKKGQHENWKDKEIDGMEGFYVTLNDMLQDGYFDNWQGNRYTIKDKDDQLLSDFLAFVAPCLYQTIIDTNYITTSELVISEETHDVYGDYLSLKIILNQVSKGLVDNEELVLAEARIYVGNNQFDEMSEQ
jgi:hypothetical protein